jgi:hypothetical protein
MLIPNKNNKGELIYNYKNVLRIKITKTSFHNYDDKNV